MAPNKSESVTWWLYIGYTLKLLPLSVPPVSHTQLSAPFDTGWGLMAKRHGVHKPLAKALNSLVELKQASEISKSHSPRYLSLACSTPAPTCAFWGCAHGLKSQGPLDLRFPDSTCSEIPVTVLFSSTPPLLHVSRVVRKLTAFSKTRLKEASGAQSLLQRIYVKEESQIWRWGTGTTAPFGKDSSAPPGGHPPELPHLPTFLEKWAIWISFPGKSLHFTTVTLFPDKRGEDARVRPSTCAPGPGPPRPTDASATWGCHLEGHWEGPSWSLASPPGFFRSSPPNPLPSAVHLLCLDPRITRRDSWNAICIRGGG